MENDANKEDVHMSYKLQHLEDRLVLILNAMQEQSSKITQIANDVRHVFDTLKDDRQKESKTENANNRKVILNK
jgi:hypothetical protein